MKLRDEWKWIVPLVAVAVLIYLNSLGGDFVYDDTRQILRNTLIQDNGLIWKALTSDVWAFKGDGTLVASNYWRPTFTAWHIINFRLFGMNPVGWHVTNVALHALVCVLSYLSLRRWAFSTATAFVISLIFAVHPVHVENVAWIAGSPDLLFSAAFLGSLWFARSFAETKSSKYLALAAVLYALALGAKEVGILCLPIYYFVLTDVETKDKKKGGLNTPLVVLGAVAVVYFFVRLAILGGLSQPPEEAVGLQSAIMSVPEMFAFYLRHIFFPYPLAANYPVEAVSQIGAMNFVLPLIVSLAALAGIFFLAEKDNKARLAAGLFLLPLIPAMNATVFTPEQIVHDRYLYLPLLGALMLIVPLAARVLSEKSLLIAGIVIAAGLSAQTFLYNRTWANEIALWSNARAQDSSSFTTAQYAGALDDAGRYDEAIQEYTASINKKPRVRSYLGRARALIKKQQYEAAEKDLKTILQIPVTSLEAYALYQSYEALGMLYSETRNYDAAVKNFNDARTKLPIYSAALSEKLAVVLYQAGQKDQALRELEGAKAQARRELLPESKAVFLRLGMLYNELGRKDEARAALREYLTLTASVRDEQTTQERSQAAKLLDSIR